MPDEKKEWESITIRYSYNDEVTIHKEDLDKIDALEDVIGALERGRRLAADIRGLLGD